MRPIRCSSFDGSRWQVQVHQRAKCLKVQALASGIRGDKQANFMVPDGTLDGGSLSGFKSTVLVDSGTASARVEANGDAGKLCGQAISDPARSVVILAEHDAPVACRPATPFLNQTDFAEVMP